MIRVSVLYPNAAGTKFDMAYYCNKHIPMVKQLLGIACKRIDVDHGLTGAQPELSATFAAMAHLTFDSVDAFQIAFGPNAEAIMRDLPMFTNINPTIQISEAVI